MNTFPIFDVTDCRRVGDEFMGSKEKYWIEVSSERGLGPKSRWLFKWPERFRDEAWTEKFAAELADLIGLPHAHIEFASDRQNGEPKIGTISRSFVNRSNTEELAHGSDLMELQQRTMSSYVLSTEEQPGLDAVYDYLKENKVDAPTPTDSLGDAAFYFTGYLALDALLGNVDRHHENWGILEAPRQSKRLAPTFDHAACLGRELQDKKRRQRIKYKQVEAYAAHGKAKITPPGRHTRVPPFDLLEFLPSLGQRSALCHWLSCVASLGPPQFERLFAQMPADLVSDAAKEFSLAYLRVAGRKLEQIHARICL